MGDVLRLEREPTNVKDKFSVAVLKRSIIVGLTYMLYNIARVALFEKDEG